LGSKVQKKKGEAFHVPKEKGKTFGSQKKKKKKKCFEGRAGKRRIRPNTRGEKRGIPRERKEGFFGTVCAKTKGPRCRDRRGVQTLAEQRKVPLLVGRGKKRQGHFSQKYLYLWSKKKKADNQASPPMGRKGGGLCAEKEESGSEKSG